MNIDLHNLIMIFKINFYVAHSTQGKYTVLFSEIFHLELNPCSNDQDTQKDSTTT